MQQHDRDDVVRAAQATWASSPALRAEFSSLETFTAYRLAVARGAAKIYSGGVTTWTAEQAAGSAVELKVSGASVMVRMRAPLQLTASTSALPERFNGVAYSGGLIPKYNAVLDLATTRYGARLPLLNRHDHSVVLGVIERAETRNHELRVEGRIFSDMPGSQAERIAQVAQRGAPFQLSIGGYEFDQKTIRAGETVVVNGRQFTGPLEVLGNGSIREISLVTLGADSETWTDFAPT